MAKQYKSLRMKISKLVLFFGLFILGLFSFPTEESKAASPEHDPWYYVEREKIDFIVPDKFQHFYGSAVLTEIIGPMPALAFGMLKEIHDDKDGWWDFR